VAPEARAAAARASAGPGPAWTVVETGTVAGVQVEVYRRADGPELVLLPDPTGRALTVQAWLQRGWADDPPGARGQADAWAHHQWPATLAAPRQGWVGVTRDQSAAVAVGSPSDAEALVAWAGAPWSAPLAPPDGPHPDRDRAAASRRAVRRTWVEVLSSGKPPCAEPPPPLWVAAGALDRRQLLEAVGRLPLARGPACPTAPPLARAGPRAPVEAPDPSPGAAGPRARVALVGWAVPGAEVQALAHLRALALLLAGPPQRLAPALPGAGLAGVEVLTEVGPRGPTLELFAALGPTGTATQAAAVARAQLTEIGRGATTGLQVEQARLAVRADALRTWARLEGRGQLVVEQARPGEAGLVDRLRGYLEAAAEVEEPAVRALARQLAQRPPVVVVASPSPSGEDAL
jgi:hypothetical protein